MLQGPISLDAICLARSDPPPQVAEKKTAKEEEHSELSDTQWEVAADLPGNERLIPIQTEKRPGLAVWNRKEQSLGLVELTVPHEDNLTAAHERKQDRYEKLVRECEERGWTVRHYSVEVGCRCFVGHSMRRWLKIAGLRERETNKMVRKMQEVVEKASHWIWLKRDDASWMVESEYLSSGSFQTAPSQVDVMVRSLRMAAIKRKKQQKNVYHSM